MKQEIRVLVADDHYLFRHGLIQILKGFPDIFVISEFSTGTELVEKYPALLPDVALIDISFQDINGFNALAKILKKCPEARIIFLTMHKSDTYIYKAYKSGALGLLNKDVTPDELHLAINRVVKGERYFQFFHTVDALENFIRKYEPLNNDRNQEEIEFTYQEDQILRFINQGLKSAEMAERLNVTVHTINYYRAQLIKKLNLKSGNELIVYASRYG